MTETLRLSAAKAPPVASEIPITTKAEKMNFISGDLSFAIVPSGLDLVELGGLGKPLFDSDHL
jgi:hypothetical protein